ncbi:MAG: internalization-related competence protein ComEC/Rec2 [Myxococcales bacterium]|nr:internalization-related competence protein ComEC/Rec2 [Myxococcales bacterium]
MSGVPVALGPLPMAIAVALGIALAPVIGLGVWLWWALAAALILARRHHPALLLAAAAAAGRALGTRAPSVLPLGVVADDRAEDRVVGIVRGPVVDTGHGRGAVLDTGGAEVWVWASEPLVPGRRVAATGRVRTSARRSTGAHELTARTLDDLGDDAGLRDRAWRWAAATQARWSATIERAGGDRGARAALRGITIGDRRDIPPALDDRWRAVGIFHVLSVSGLHLAVIAGLVFALLRRLIAASPWGGRIRPARWAAPPALMLALAYTLITGAQLATLRALLVIAFVLIGAMLDRPIRLVDALGAAAILLLAWRPEDVFDPSFQLSFTAALTLALRPASERRGVRGWIVRGLTTSAWVTITTAPITAYQFGQVCPGGVIGNLLLTPLVELLALPLALAGIALGPIGTPLIELATWIVARVDAVAELLAHVLPVGTVAVASGVTVAILVALSLVLTARAQRTRFDLVAWGALCLVWSLARTPPPTGGLRVTFLDVSQGDAALIELPDGAVWLIDAGGHANARELAAASKPGVTITRALAAAGHDAIDIALLSHPHPDHYLGLAGITPPIGELWSAAEPARSGSGAPGGGLPSFADIARVLADRGTRLVHPPLGLARSQAGVDLLVWGPRYRARDGEPEVGAIDPVRTVNDNSLVIELRYRGRSFLFAGDIEAEGEEVLVAAGLPRVDVVKVPHHGSPTSSSQGLVDATRPSLAVISCGRANAFGFPSAAVVARWRAAGADVAQTDRTGAITVVVDAAGRLFVVQ